MPTTRSDSRARVGGRRRAPDVGRAARRQPGHQGFHKERATLLLLTVTLGLGLGASIRFVQRADQARTVAAGQAPYDGTPTQANTGIPFQNQRVVVLPQRGFSGRATSRMS